MATKNKTKQKLADSKLTKKADKTKAGKNVRSQKLNSPLHEQDLPPSVVRIRLTTCVGSLHSLEKASSFFTPHCTCLWAYTMQIVRSIQIQS